MDFIVIIIMLIIIIVVGYILSRPFVRSDDAPETSLEIKKPSGQSDEIPTKIEDPERIISNDQHPGGDNSSR